MIDTRLIVGLNIDEERHTTMVEIVIQVHTEGMAISVIEWEQLVQFAMLNDQQADLLALFAQGQQLFGSQAGERWAAALSGFDASAVTG